MIETEQSIVIDAPIGGVWNYVQDMRRWASLFPGCRECDLIDRNDSRWVIKVGAGGLVRTVNVRVHVDRWAGPERVEFSYKLDGEPVEGVGTYTATAIDARQTRMSLKVRVCGSGPMAPMWEAVSRPLLPQLARAFAGKLKSEIEKSAGVTAPIPSSWWLRLLKWLRRLLREAPAGEASMNEQNREVVLRFIHAMGTSDAEAAKPCLDPEASTLAKGFGKFAGKRTYETIVGTIGAFKILLPTGLRPTVHTVTTEGDRVVVEFDGDSVTSEGKPYCNQYCMVFTMRNGRILQVNEYFCNKLADEVLWPLVEKMQRAAG